MSQEKGFVGLFFTVAQRDSRSGVRHCALLVGGGSKVEGNGGAGGIRGSSSRFGNDDGGGGGGGDGFSSALTNSIGISRDSVGRGKRKNGSSRISSSIFVTRSDGFG